MSWDHEDQRDRWEAAWAAEDYEFDDLSNRVSSGEYWPEDTTTGSEAA